MASAGAAAGRGGLSRQPAGGGLVPARRGARLQIPPQALERGDAEVLLRAARRRGDQGQVRAPQPRGVRGGGGRAALGEIDALRRVAVFLAGWDNKPANQRLVCLPGAEDPAGGCGAPLALLQDVGATFGPLAVDLEAWRKAPMWAERATCRVSMRSLPFQGATFVDVDITEGGRRLLASE